MNNEASKIVRIPYSYHAGLAWCLLWGIVTGLHFAVLKVGNSLVDSKPNVLYFFFFIFLFITIFTYATGKYRDIDFSMMGLDLFFKLSRHSQILIVQRSLYGLGIFVTSYFSVKLLPLHVSTPLFMTSVLVTLLIGNQDANEKLTKREIITIICGFIGILIVVLPFN